MAFLLPSSLPRPGAASRTALTATPSSSSPDPTPTNGNWLRAASLLALTILPSAIASPAGAFDAKGVKLFENNCASCHVGGGNIIGWVLGGKGGREGGREWWLSGEVGCLVLFLGITKGF